MRLNSLEDLEESQDLVINCTGLGSASLECAILGSVDIPNNWNTEIFPENSRKILESCKRICPHIKKADIVAEAVGLRPCRKWGVRLELDENYSGKHCKVIHNYGHGGSGITLSWGCAKQVLDIIQHCGIV